MAELDDNMEVMVRDEVMTLGEAKARLKKLAETETPFEREQRMFDDALWHLQQIVMLGEWTQRQLDDHIIETWTGDYHDGRPRLGKPHKTDDGRWILVPIAH